MNGNDRVPDGTVVRINDDLRQGYSYMVYCNDDMVEARGLCGIVTRYIGSGYRLNIQGFNHNVCDYCWTTDMFTLVDEQAVSTTNRYNVGDVVYIRADLHTCGIFDANDYDGINVVEDMVAYAGQQMIIRDITGINRYALKTVGELNVYFIWSSEMFDKGIVDTTLDSTNSFTCEICGQTISNSRLSTRANTCNSCYYDITHNSIHTYHNKIGEYIQHGSGDIFYGFELEVSHPSYSRQQLNLNAFEIKKIMGDLIYDIQHDCSIRNGFEIISNPLSEEYIKTTFQPKLKELCDYLKREKFTVSPISCGFHVHATRKPIEAKNNEAVNYMLYALEVFKREIQSYAKRESTSYGKYLYDYAGKIESFKDVISKKGRANEDRYCAINNTNSKTIEFRMFRSSRKVEDINNYFNIVFGLVHFGMNEFVEGNFSEIFNLTYPFNGNETKIASPIGYIRELHLEKQRAVRILKKIRQLAIDDINGCVMPIISIDTSYDDISSIVRDYTYSLTSYRDIIQDVHRMERNNITAITKSTIKDMMIGVRSNDRSTSKVYAYLDRLLSNCTGQYV